jgi:LacI family transcriptional regulator
MSSAHGRGLIRGVAEYAQRHTDWSLHLEEVGPLRAVPHWLKVWQGGGIIARIETPEIARVVQTKRAPLVNVSGRASPAGVPRVDTDNRAVCELVVDYFLQRGYRNFSFCGNPRFEWSRWRQELFAKRLASERVFFAAFQVYDQAQDMKLLPAWLKALPKPIALFACNDLCGRHVLEACEQTGLAVPGEIAVLGVDDDDILCTVCRPQLSSVVPDTEGIGYLAAQTLHGLMRGEEMLDTPRLVQPLSVRTRQSTDSATSSNWHVSQALRFIHGRRGGPGAHLPALPGEAVLRRGGAVAPRRDFPGAIGDLATPPDHHDNALERRGCAFRFPARGLFEQCVPRKTGTFPQRMPRTVPVMRRFRLKTTIVWRTPCPERYSTGWHTGLSLMFPG